MVPKVDKKHFSYSPVGARLQEIGTVGALATLRKRERDPGDFLSQGKRSTKRQSNVGFETKNQRASNTLSLRQRQTTGKMGGGATSVLVKRKLGIAAGTEMEGKDKLVEVNTSKTPKQKDDARLAKDAADLKTIHSKKKFELMDLVHPTIRPRDAVSGGKLVGGKTSRERLHGRKVSAAKKRLSTRDTKREGEENTLPATKPIKTRVAIRKVHHQRDVALAQKAADREVRIAASTELDWTHKLVEHLIVEKDWIQGAVNPAHKGFCTPMSAKTCTPKRKALAKRFKKAGRKEKRSGGTGWEGKV